MNKAFVLRFASYLGNVHQEHMKCPRQLSVSFSCREHGLLSGFSWFIRAETSLEGCEHEVIPPQVTQMKMWRKFAKKMYDDQCSAILQCLREQVCQKCLEWWWNQDCWFTAAISGSWQNGCCPPLTWFGPLWFLLVSKNEIASLRALLSECPQNSGTVAICLVYNSKSIFQ